MEPQKCPKCKSLLFAAIPLQTTRQAIVEFAQNSSLRNKEAIIRGRWIHPGVYCPNGCFKEYWDYHSAMMPELTVDEELTVIAEYSKQYLSDFTKTQGENSR
jgi:hypothetical protein